jgi:hypothetical protein
MRTHQTQLRIEASVKNQFQQACRQSGSNMTAEIYRFMRDFIKHQSEERSVIKQLEVLDIQRRTGMVQDHRGTWMSRKEYRLLQENEAWLNEL